MRFRIRLVLPGSTARAIAQFASQDDNRPVLKHVALWFPDRDYKWVMAATDSYSFAVISNDVDRTSSDLTDVATTKPHHLLQPGVVAAMLRTRKTAGLLALTSPAVLYEGSWRLRAQSSGMNTQFWPTPGPLNDWGSKTLQPGATMHATTLSKIARFSELTDSTIELMGSTGKPDASPLVWRTTGQTYGITAFGMSMPVRNV